MDKLLEIYDQIEKKASNCARILEVMGLRPPRKAMSEYAISEAAGIPLEEVKECLGIMQRSGRVRKATTRNTSFWESNMKGGEKMVENVGFEIDVPDHDRQDKEFLMEWLDKISPQERWEKLRRIMGDPSFMSWKNEKIVKGK